MTVDIDDILKSLTLDEKISLLAGKNFWETQEYPEKNVPSLKVSDGPNGARGATFSGGTTSACFPSSTSLASTWDVSLARQVGNALAEETMTKGAYCLLAPTVCPHRHPLGGRNFESFSEDPLLAGEMAASYINGVQELGVAATIKHFAANEQETDRFTVNVTVGERALREVYLKPFEIAVKKAKPWAVMTSYNLLNGVHADASEFLLEKVLRGQWGWKGLVMSDWGGTNSTAATLNAGQDLEMPGPSRWRTRSQVQKALDAGETTESVIDDRCRNILELLVKTGKYSTHPDTPEEKAVNKPEHQKLIRKVGSSGVVLLKNEGNILPLKKEKYKGKKIAVLGIAKDALIHGGGSAAVNAHYRITPWEALTTAFGDDVELQYSKGAQTFRLLPVLLENVVDLERKPGWTLEMYESIDFAGSPHEVRHLDTTSWTPFDETTSVQINGIKLKAKFTPSESGSHYLGASGLGPTKLLIDGETVTEQKENHKDFMGFLLGGGDQKVIQHAFEKGKEYDLELVSLNPGANKSGLSLLDGRMGFYLGFMLQSVYEEDVLSDAVSKAKACDAAIIFTGHTPDWETEGQDQLSFNLPARGSLDTLVSSVADVNKNIVVVNSTGTPVAMPWLSKISALLQAWFPGQEAGNAIVDVLTGAVNPSGRLPTSFPKRLEDAPAYGNFPGKYENGRLEVKYEEGVFIGYRHYDRHSPEKLLFPFGFGLSYTTFAISDLRVSQKGSDFTATVSVKNTGDIAGAHVVQVYVGADYETKIETPIKVLAGFDKVHLQAGESRDVEVAFGREKLAYFGEEKGKWVVEKGRYKVSVGRSVVGIEETEVVEVEGEEFDP